jgi:hypothetical protein
MAVGACLVWAALGCTTEESGIRVGSGGASGTGGQGTGQDAGVDAPMSGGKCNPALDRALGAPCGCGDECASGFCADGVCCNAQCTGACVACNQPSRMGECTAVRTGQQDPHGVCMKQEPATCGRDGTCNGAGACARYPAGVTCKAASCSGGGLTPASSCDGNGTCLAGSPINCSPSLCVDGACKVVCASNADCAVPNMCTGGSCGLRGLGQPCDNTGQCRSGFCADGVCCESACTGKCMNCGLKPSLGRCVPVPLNAADPRLAAGVTNQALVCADQGAASCGTNGRCDGMGGCQRYPDSTPCKDQTCDATTNRWVAESVCTGGACVTPPARDCMPNRCSGSRCGSSCASNADCTAGNSCINGSCGKKSLGTLCGQDSECFSNFCAHGVCCNGRCNGVCQTCSAAGSQGICISVPAGGADPTRTCTDQGATSCGNDGTCNGSGGCRKYKAGTQCAPAKCAGGVVTSPSLCNGTGACQAGTSKDCPGIMCDPALPQCLSGCTRDSQCIAPNVCQNGKCGQSGPGGPCDDVSDCKQTPNPQFCVSGVCCNVSACSGCKTCATGTCTNVGAGKAPPGGGCATDPANPICGNSGTCDGGGKCTVAAAGTSCGDTCDGDSKVAKTCPGNGALCKDGTPVACNPFTCHSGACAAAPCTGNGDCAAGKVCAGGACKNCNPANQDGCPLGKVCVNDTCKTPAGGSCSATGECAAGSCVGSPLRCCDCPAPNSCTDAGCSMTGVCNFHAAGTTCPPKVCNSAGDGMVENTCDGAGTCTSTTKTTDCPAGSPKCTGGSCGKRADGELCSGASECSSGICLQRCCTAACITDAPCGTDRCLANGTCGYSQDTCGSATCTSGDTKATTPHCKDGTCSEPISVDCATGLKCQGGVCPSSCSGDGDCLADYTCAGGTCKKRPGKSCGTDDDCAAGDCIGKICCKTGCKKTDDHGCGVGCDASGDCNFTAAGTSCGGPRCADGTTQIPGATCNSGVCVDDAPVSCTTCVDPGGMCTP